jgi:hypothetical protein
VIARGLTDAAFLEESDRLDLRAELAAVDVAVLARRGLLAVRDGARFAAAESSGDSTTWASSRRRSRR